MPVLLMIHLRKPFKALNRHLGWTTLATFSWRCNFWKRSKQVHLVESSTYRAWVTAWLDPKVNLISKILWIVTKSGTQWLSTGRANCVIFISRNNLIWSSNIKILKMSKPCLYTQVQSKQNFSENIFRKIHF